MVYRACIQLAGYVVYLVYGAYLPPMSELPKAGSFFAPLKTMDVAPPLLSVD